MTQHSERVGLISSLFEHPGWGPYQAALDEVIQFCRKNLESRSYPPGTDALTQLADIRSLQREIQAYKWVRDRLPALLTAELPVAQVEGEEGPYAETRRSAGTELAGQSFYSDEPGVQATPGGDG